MKRKIFTLMFLLAFLAMGTSPGIAVTVTKPFVVSATIPSATGISITATRVTSSNNQFGAQVSALDFNPMVFNALNSIWLPDHYFAIDVGSTGGAGSPNVTVTYGSETNPTGQVKGLGFKSTANFVLVKGATGSQTETPLTAHGPKKLLKSLTGENITATELASGFLRVYVGVFPGDDTAILTAGGEPFTNADKPGTYQGTLTVSATVP